MDQRKRRRIVGRAVGGIILLGVASLIVMGFMPKPIPVSIGKVEKRPLEVTVDETGKTRIRSRYVVSAPVMGSVARIALKPGDEVKEGDVIAQMSSMAPQLLDPRTRNEANARVGVAAANVERARVTTKRAEAALQFARTEAERLRSLRASQGTSAQSLEQAEFQLRAAEEDYAAAQFGEHVAEHEVDMARATVQSMTPGAKSGPGIALTAPITGRVLRVFQESEAVVQPGTPLVELGDPSMLEVVVDVLTTDAVKIPLGAEARIERWGGDVALNARVRKKEPSAFTTRSALGVEEQRVPVILDIVDPREKWASLGDGYRVETRIRVAFVEGAVVAPASSVFRDGTSWAAFAVEQGRTRKKPLTIGARTPDWVEVQKGLAQGNTVVLYPSDQVRDGIEVEATEPTPSK